MVDKAKLFFTLGAGVLVIGGTFVAGLYSAVRENAAYDLVWGTLDNAKTLYEELPNLRGTEPVHFLKPARYDGSGVTKNLPGAEAGDLILMSGFFEDDNAVRLIRRDGTVVREWKLKAHTLFPDVSFFRDPPMTDWNAIPHGVIATPDGDIVLSFESGGLFRLDRCGKPKWTVPDRVTHHSPNWMADGGIVIAGGEYIDKPNREIPWPFAGPYWEDLVFKFDADGKQTLSQPMTETFIANGMAPVVTASSSFRTRVDGEFHLNEVEELSPALAPDFPMFAAGDLLLSFRNLNMIMVTDPTAKTVKWWKIGPWVRQHDPDFEKGGRITVFDNHSDESLDGTLQGGSRVWEIDPATNTARTLYGGTPEQFMYTAERGTHQSQPNGNMMITEAQAGRSFEVTPAGQVVWEYVNRFDAGRTAWLHDAETYPAGFFTVTDWNACN